MLPDFHVVTVVSIDQHIVMTTVVGNNGNGWHYDCCINQDVKMVIKTTDREKSWKLYDL